MLEDIKCILIQYRNFIDAHESLPTYFELQEACKYKMQSYVFEFTFNHMLLELKNAS